jgi:hypothetical protein
MKRPQGWAPVLAAAFLGVITVIAAGKQPGSENSSTTHAESICPAAPVEAECTIRTESRSPQMISSWAAIIAGVAAAIGLIFTAHSVDYQAEQTKLQVATNQLEVNEQNKQQARLMNLWPADEFSPRRLFVVVSNRSEEPIYQFRIYIALATKGTHGYLAISTWTSFPPCTQVTFNLWPIAESYAETARLMTASRHLPAFDYGIMFKDATGQAWHRHASGMLHPTPWLEYLVQKGHYSPVLPPVFRTFTALTSDTNTVPEASQRFIDSGPKQADSCDPNV